MSMQTVITLFLAAICSATASPNLVFHAPEPGYIVLTMPALTPVHLSQLRHQISVSSVLHDNANPPQYTVVEMYNGIDTAVSFLEERGYMAVPESNLNVQFFTDEVTPYWHLDRLDEYEYPLDGHFRAPGLGTSSNIYVLDTGIDIGNPVFGNRAVRTYRNEEPCIADFSTNPPTYGTHGTWVASLAAGNQYGVARGATVHDVKITAGSGCQLYTFQILAALTWLKSQPTPNIAVMSWATVGARSPCIEMLCDQLKDGGTAIFAAAGNDGSATEACQISPAAAQSTEAVGATNNNGAQDIRATFSNHDACVDVYAPGTALRGANANNRNGIYIASGTSGAAPIAAGLAAVYDSVGNYSRGGGGGSAGVDALLEAVHATALQNVISGVGGDGSSLLVSFADEPDTPASPPSPPPVSPPPSPPPVSPPPPPPPIGGGHNQPVAAPSPVRNAGAALCIDATVFLVSVLWC